MSLIELNCTDAKLNQHYILHFQFYSQNLSNIIQYYRTQTHIAQSAGAVEYTDGFSAEV